MNLFALILADENIAPEFKRAFAPTDCMVRIVQTEEEPAEDEAEDAGALTQEDLDELAREREERFSPAPGFGPWGSS